MVWLLGIPTDRKSFPQVAVNACLDRFYCIYLPFQKIMTQRNIVALEAGIYLYSLFVCCSALLFFVSPHFCRAFFLCTDFVSVLPSGTNSYSFFLARKKMMIIVEVVVVVVVGFNCV